MRGSGAAGPLLAQQPRRAAGHALVGRRAALGDRRAAGADRRHDVLAGFGRGDCRRPPDLLADVRRTSRRTQRASISCSTWLRQPERDAADVPHALLQRRRHRRPRCRARRARDARRRRSHVDAVDRAARRRASTRLGLTARTNLVLVSDHGMAPLSRDRVDRARRLHRSVAPSTSIDSAPIVGAQPAHAGIGRARSIARSRTSIPRCEVYTRERPAGRAIGCAVIRGCPPVIGIADDGWHVTTRERAGARDADGFPAATTATTRATSRCTACSSPPARSSAAASSCRAFENVHVYELMCRVLGLRPAPNDGDPQSPRVSYAEGARTDTMSRGTMRPRSFERRVGTRPARGER